MAQNRCKDKKIYSNYQISVFYTKKVVSSDLSLTTYDLLLIVYKRLFCCVFETFHH